MKPKRKRNLTILRRSLGALLLLIGIWSLIYIASTQIWNKKGFFYQAVNQIDNLYSVKYQYEGYTQIIPDPLQVFTDYWGKNVRITGVDKNLPLVFDKPTWIAVVQGELMSRSIRLEGKPGEAITLFYSRVPPLGVPGEPGKKPSFWDQNTQIGGYIQDSLGNQIFRNPLSEGDAK